MCFVQTNRTFRKIIEGILWYKTSIFELNFIKRDYDIYKNENLIAAIQNLKLSETTLNFLNQKLKDISNLHLYGPNISNDISSLAYCKNMHTLILTHCDDLESLTCLTKCVKLEILVLRKCKRLPDLTILSQCKSLNTLHIDIPMNYPDEMIDFLISNINIVACSIWY